MAKKKVKFKGDFIFTSYLF